MKRDQQSRSVEWLIDKIVYRYFKLGGLSISRQLLVVVLVVGSVLTLLSTIAEVSLDYRREVRGLESNLALVESGSAKSVARSLWDINMSQLKVQLDGLLNIPGIQYIRISDKSKVIFEVGSMPLANSKIKSFPLTYKNNTDEISLGEMTVVANTDSVWEKMQHRIVIIFLAQLIQILMVSFLILLSYRYMLTRHLIVTTKYLKELNFETVTEDLRLHRKLDSDERMAGSIDPKTEDELDTLVKAINQMKANLFGSYAKVEKANQAKSEFLANMSHEIRTPMHGILSFSRFGLQKIDTADKEKLKSYFSEINESGSRLMNLLNDLLDLSRLEAGKVVYDFRELDLAEISSALAAEMRAFAEEKGLTIQIKNPTAPLIGLMDRDKIMQVVRNLTSNAIKFSSPGNVVQFILEQTEAHVSFCVINRGVGIPASELETVFDKFIQSSKTRTGAGGTGLGLSISKEIVQQHHGRIWAESNPDGETKFTFEIPKKVVVSEAISARAS
jgi:signal transduction histidine kinase